MTVRFLVSGLVQGVGFRYFVARQAAQAGLAGWAKNLSDGRVEVVVRGSAEAVLALESELHRGPRLGRVDGISKAEISDELVPGNTFTVR